jgi:hypothetical protein
MAEQPQWAVYRRHLVSVSRQWTGLDKVHRRPSNCRTCALSRTESRQFAPGVDGLFCGWAVEPVGLDVTPRGSTLQRLGVVIRREDSSPSRATTRPVNDLSPRPKPEPRRGSGPLPFVRHHLGDRRGVCRPLVDDLSGRKVIDEISSRERLKRFVAGHPNIIRFLYRHVAA